jgi:hypothetical protein
VSNFQAALAWNLDHTLERVPSLCPTRQGNSLRRGVGGTLASWGFSTPLKVEGELISFALYQATQNTMAILKKKNSILFYTIPLLRGVDKHFTEETKYFQMVLI